MSNPVELPEMRQREYEPVVNVLDETLWKKWQAKNLLRDAHNAGVRATVIAWVCAGLLLTSAAVALQDSPYSVAVRFVLSLGALVLAVRAVHTGRHMLGALFAAMFVLYNPVFPALMLSGSWQRVLLMGSAVLFAASSASIGARNPDPIFVQDGRGK